MIFSSLKDYYNDEKSGLEDSSNVGILNKKSNKANPIILVNNNNILHNESSLDSDKKGK